MFYLVDKSNIELMIPKVYPGLSRSEYSSDIGSTLTTTQLIDQIREGDALGFIDSNSRLAGAFSIYTSFNITTLHLFWGGQDIEYTDVPIDYEELDSFLIQVAKVFGAQRIKVTGRKGWERKVKNLGYITETINLFKEVPV